MCPTVELRIDQTSQRFNLATMTSWRRQFPLPPGEISAPAAWNNMMKQTYIAVLTGSGAANLTRKRHRPLPVDWALLCGLCRPHAMPDLGPSRGRSPRQRTGHPARTGPDASPDPSGPPDGALQSFARQAQLPSITATNSTVLEVGGMARTDAARLAQLSTREQEALAGQFGVPVGVITKVVQRLASGSPPAADQLAQELRTAVIDYRFLQIEWKRYHPPAEGQRSKVAALEALQAGDIGKAWELYDALRKPQAPAIGAPAPPVNLRVVAQP